MRLDDPRAIQILATEHWSLLAVALATQLAYGLSILRRINERMTFHFPSYADDAGSRRRKPG